MDSILTIKFTPLVPGNTDDRTKKALTWLIDFATEGGLTNEINPRMRQDIGLECYVTGSSSTSLQFSVNKVQQRIGK